MKSIFVSFFLVSLIGRVSAQAVASDDWQRNMDTRRAEIGAERTKLATDFLAEENACYKKFAVNNCLNNVNIRRRESIADLRRQEILINDEERRFRGTKQIQRIDEKSSTEKNQVVIERTTRANERYELRQEREDDKKRDRASARSNEKTARDANAEKLSRNQKKAVERSGKLAAAADEARKYAERQNEAERRRAEYEAYKAKKVKPAAKPLPVPEL